MNKYLLLVFVFTLQTCFVHAKDESSNSNRNSYLLLSVGSNKPIDIRGGFDSNWNKIKFSGMFGVHGRADLLIVRNRFNIDIGFNYSLLYYKDKSIPKNYADISAKNSAFQFGFGYKLGASKWLPRLQVNTIGLVSVRTQNALRRGIAIIKGPYNNKEIASLGNGLSCLWQFESKSGTLFHVLLSSNYYYRLYEIENYLLIGVSIPLSKKA